MGQGSRGRRRVWGGHRARGGSLRKASGGSGSVNPKSRPGLLLPRVLSCRTLGAVSQFCSDCMPRRCPATRALGGYPRTKTRPERGARHPTVTRQWEPQRGCGHLQLLRLSFLGSIHRRPLEVGSVGCGIRVQPAVPTTLLDRRGSVSSAQSPCLSGSSFFFFFPLFFFFLNLAPLHQTLKFIAAKT